MLWSNSFHLFLWRLGFYAWIKKIEIKETFFNNAVWDIIINRVKYNNSIEIFHKN